MNFIEWILFLFYLFIWALDSCEVMECVSWIKQKTVLEHKQEM